MAQEIRLISLIASATEIVDALGLGPFQVGRSHECDYPEEVRPLPVCTRPRIDVGASSAEIDRQVRESLRSATSVYEVFEDLMESLRPTHILTQTQCRVCAVSLEDVEKAMADRFPSRPRVVALEPNSLEDIWADIRRVGEACGLADGGRGLVARLQTRMSEIAARAGGGARPKVACVEWIEPLMMAGHWTPQLVEMAGAEVSDDPEIVIVAPCGFDMERARQELHRLPAGLRGRRVYVADGNQYFNRPGPRVVETLRILAEICHPDRFEPTLEGVGWLRV